MQIIKKRKLWDEAFTARVENAKTTATENAQKNTASEGGIGTMYSNRDVLSWDIAWDSDNFSSLKSQTVNVAVAVLFGDKNRPHSMRVLMLSGNEFVIGKEKANPGREAASRKSDVGSPTGSASNKKVPQPTAESQEQKSDRDYSRAVKRDDMAGSTTPEKTIRIFGLHTSKINKTPFGRQGYALQTPSTAKKSCMIFGQ